MRQTRFHFEQNDWRIIFEFNAIYNNTEIFAKSKWNEIKNRRVSTTKTLFTPSENNCHQNPTKFFTWTEGLHPLALWNSWGWWGGWWGGWCGCWCAEAEYSSRKASPMKTSTSSVFEFGFFNELLYFFKAIYRCSQFAPWWWNVVWPIVQFLSFSCF